MPNTKSATKRLKQNIQRRKHNRSVKSAISTQLRKAREAIASGDAEKGELECVIAARKLDQAAAHHILHRNRAARIKSRLQRRLKAAQQG